jgi:hypothetical protein
MIWSRLPPSLFFGHLFLVSDLPLLPFCVLILCLKLSVSIAMAPVDHIMILRLQNNTFNRCKSFGHPTCRWFPLFSWRLISVARPYVEKVFVRNLVDGPSTVSVHTVPLGNLEITKCISTRHSLKTSPFLC